MIQRPYYEPFYRIFPDSRQPATTLVLNRKTGAIPKGSYALVEYYCTVPCDCRRVTLVAVNEKLKEKAVIHLGFDQEGPMAGPYLDASSRQAPYAPELLKFCVDLLNSDHLWLARMYRRYGAVRQMVDGKPYRGRRFPKPGKLEYAVMPPPDLEAELEQSLINLLASPVR